MTTCDKDDTLDLIHCTLNLEIQSFYRVCTLTQGESKHARLSRELSGRAVLSRVRESVSLCHQIHPGSSSAPSKWACPLDLSIHVNQTRRVDNDVQS